MKLKCRHLFSWAADYQPGSLQELSRGVIRRLLRARLDREKLPKPRRHLVPPRLRSSSSSGTVVPFRGTGSSTSTGGDSGSSSGDEPHRKRSAGGETSLLWKRAALDDVCPQAMVGGAFFSFPSDAADANSSNERMFIKLAVLVASCGVTLRNPLSHACAGAID